MGSGGTGGPQQVLHRQRHAVQRASGLPRGDLLVGGAGIPQCLIRHHGDVTVQACIHRIDPFQHVAGDFLGGPLPALNLPAHFHQIHIVQFVVCHSHCSSSPDYQRQR